MNKMVQIYPPVLDNSQGAFLRTDEKVDIYFYFQNSEQEVLYDYVVPKVQLGSESALKIADKPYICQKRNPEISKTSYEQYVVTIPMQDFKNNQFIINSAYQFSIASIRNTEENQNQIKRYNTINENQRSNFSSSIVKYALPDIKFSLWGGLTSDEILSPNSLIGNAQNFKELHEYEANPLQLVSDVYRVKGKLEFIQAEDEAIKETDVLSWYQLKFYILNSADRSANNFTASAERQYIDREWDLQSLNFAHVFDYDFNELNSQFKDDDQKLLQLMVLFGTKKGYLGIYSYSFYLEETENSIQKTVNKKNCSKFFFILHKNM